MRTPRSVLRRLAAGGRRLPAAFGLLAALGAALLTGCGGAAESGQAAQVLPERVDFNFHIKPILSDRCFTCHGPDDAQREAGLALHTREGLFAALDSAGTHFAVVPGDLAGSEVHRRITSTDPDEMMPPPESNLSLSDYEVRLITKWIEQGAEWKPHWSFIPPEEPEPPAVEDEAWVRDDIDRFILARLEREGLEPSPEADKATLLRRVTFDLTGLPPTPEEVDAFLADDAPDAYEKVVDRLLASPAYGERMASSWLDVARYADSHGYQDDFGRTMWPWREWVIEALNENMSYDRFVTWQLAGDLLPDASYEQILATGFNRNHAINQEAGIIPEEFRVEYVADRANTFGTAFLGLTMECARCHDHKYDPVTQEEYFQLFAFFNNVPGTEHEGGRKATGPRIPIPEERLEEIRAFAAEQVEAQRARLEARRATPPPAYETWQRETAGTLPTLPGTLSDGLLAYLPMDFAEDGAVADGYDGRRYAAHGGPVEVEGRYGAALELVDEEGIRLDGVGRLEAGNAFTVGTWIYYPVRKHMPLITKQAASGRGFGVHLNREQVRVELVSGEGNAIRLITKSGLRLNEWTHVAVSYDGSGEAAGVTVYFNGEPAGEVVQEDALSGSIRTSAPLVVGNPAGRPSSAAPVPVDEVRVYDRALLADEVAALAAHNPLGDLLAIAPGERSADEAKSLHVNYLYGYDREFQEAYRSLRHWEGRQAEVAAEVEVMVMEEREERRQTYVLDRGVYDAPTDPVEPGTPQKVLAFGEELPENRLGLAEWLFAEKNPLTARVVVNRYWDMIFGRGIVTTLDDFGNQGDLPSHPELLDYLAVSFRESGWDTKAFLKRVVMTSTYRQSSRLDPERVRRDPDNELLARGPRYRLPAEMVRDQALAASGLLVRKIGGPSVRPYQPEGLWEETTSGQGLTKYVNGTGEDLYRRSLYTFWKRTVPPPAMRTFDAASRDRCTVERLSTNTPLQALILMNDPQFMEASRILAEKVLREGERAPEERISRIFRTITSREPSEEELEGLAGYLETELEAYRADEARARALLGVGDAPADSALDAPRVAAYAMVASTVFNLDETITKE